MPRAEAGSPRVHLPVGPRRGFGRGGGRAQGRDHNAPWSRSDEATSRPGAAPPASSFRCVWCKAAADPCAKCTQRRVIGGDSRRLASSDRSGIGESSSRYRSTRHSCIRRNVRARTGRRRASPRRCARWMQGRLTNRPRVDRAWGPGTAHATGQHTRPGPSVRPGKAWRPPGPIPRGQLACLQRDSRADEAPRGPGRLPEEASVLEAQRFGLAEHLDAGRRPRGRRGAPARATTRRDRACRGSGRAGSLAILGRAARNGRRDGVAIGGQDERDLPALDSAEARRERVRVGRREVHFGEEPDRGEVGQSETGGVAVGRRP